MTIYIELPGDTRHDVQLYEPPQWQVFYGTDSSQSPVWWLLGLGLWADKAHTMQMGALTWMALRKFESQQDAYLVLRLLQTQQLDPRDVITYTLPANDTVGERVKTVADAHQRLRRRRR